MMSLAKCLTNIGKCQLKKIKVCFRRNPSQGGTFQEMGHKVNSSDYLVRFKHFKNYNKFCGKISDSGLIQHGCC